MKLHAAIAGAGLAAGLLLAPAPAPAQQTVDSLGLTILTTPAIVSDYMFRGISQTRSAPAVQGTVDVEHSSGLYVGAFASNAVFRGTNVRQEVDLSAGYRFAIGDVKLDVGGTYYFYPGYDRPTGGFNLDYYEAILRASYETAPIKFLGQVAYSPNFTGESGTGIYVEAGADITLDFGITLSLRAGYQWIERNVATATSSPNDGFFGTPDYGVVSVGFSRELIGGVIGSVTGSYTSIDRADCFGGANLCGSRVILGLTRPF